MSNFAHAVGVLCAGVLAFAGVAAGSLLLPSATPTNPPETSHATKHSDTAAALLGRWQAPEPANQNAFVEFTEYGIWFASDGCNSLSGTWGIERGGDFTVRSDSAMTAIGCDNVPIPTSIAGATSVVVESGGDLLLTDRDGEQMRLVHTRDSSVLLDGRWVSDTPDSTGSAYLDFAADGTWEGSDGCNTASGTWKLSANPSFGATDAMDFSVEGTAPGILMSNEFTGITDVACENEDPRLPLELESTTWFGFADNDHVWLIGDSKLMRADYPPTTLVRDTAS